MRLSNCAIIQERNLNLEREGRVCMIVHINCEGISSSIKIDSYTAIMHYLVSVLMQKTKMNAYEYF